MRLTENQECVVPDRKAYQQAYYKANKQRIRKQQRLYAEANKETIAEGHRRRQLKARYGLSVASYNLLLHMQAGGCAICGTVPSKKKLHVDHNHATGKVRGLLCSNCNVSIGLLYDNPALLDKAAIYLRKGGTCGS